VRTRSLFRGPHFARANAADLPVEEPTVFTFAVNQTIIQALGLTIPPGVAAQVTEWVQ